MKQKTSTEGLLIPAVVAQYDTKKKGKKKKWNISYFGFQSAAISYPVKSKALPKVQFLVKQSQGVAFPSSEWKCLICCSLTFCLKQHTVV